MSMSLEPVNDTLNGKRDFADVIKIKDLEEERAPSFIQGIPFKSYAFLKLRNLPRYSQRCNDRKLSEI